MKVTVAVLLVIMLIVLALLAYRNTTTQKFRVPSASVQKQVGKSGKKVMKKEKEDAKEYAGRLTILQRWYLPDVLTEVSDITTINDQLIACIQDEIGTIFIYDLSVRKIVKEIPFAENGDYEGIALVDKISYVVNSSGVLYEITDISKSKPLVKQYATGFKARDDIEALCYDKENNRLLIASKADEPGDNKNIYSFDLQSKRLVKQPVYVIREEDLYEDEKKGKKKKGGFKPSAMAIHPLTGDLYITQGTSPRLLVLNRQGKVKSNIKLSGKGFAQPEGITFNSKGELFISNEGGKEAGNILKVQL